jgi:RND superfamily putative drug exporter
MLCITRSLVAALVIVGTVALSLGASFGLSVLIWQYMLGITLHWIVLPMSVIVLLAVGSDYNLLLVARMKEELAGGINTGIIRAMSGTGKVVTTAGLVFAFTMAAMVFSELRSIGQVGTTIAIGLIFDTLIVRSFMTPSIAALLGRGCELRVCANLWTMIDLVTTSTLEFSIIRKRNALPRPV